MANPRRPGGLEKTGAGAREQIIWEWRHLKAARLVVFWFAAETLQPIALFELGKALGRRQRMLVGAHPDYPRRFDVEIQLRAECPGARVSDSLEELVASAVSVFGG